MRCLFKQCPRCGDFGLEKVATHSYCVNCNYYRIYDAEVRWQIPSWVKQALGQ